MVVAVCLKRFSAAGAGEVINGSAVHIILMFIPPLHPASVRAELLLPGARRLYNRSAAAIAKTAILISAAE